MPEQCHHWFAGASSAATGGNLALTSRASAAIASAILFCYLTNHISLNYDGSHTCPDSHTCVVLEASALQQMVIWRSSPAPALL